MNRREFLGMVTVATVGRALPARIPAAAHRPVIIAHRGDHTRAPENSLRAIEAALAGGADYVELDIRRSRDGEHVLMHDATVDRTTDGQGRVADLTWGELKTLRLKEPGQPAGSDTVPRLAEALERMRGRIGLYLDFKDGDREAVVRALREGGMAERTVVYDRIEAVAAWRQVAPELPLMVSPRAEDLTQERLDQLRVRYPVEILDGPATVYTAETVRSVQALGFQVWLDIQGPWEGAGFWGQILGLGADGLQSDKPAELVAFLRS